MQSLKTFIVLISGFLSLVAWSANSKRKVAIIYSYPKGEWYFGIKKGVADTFSKFDVSHYEIHDYLYDYEGLKTKPKKVQDFEIEKIRKEVSSLEADFIIINDDEAVEKFIDKFPANKRVILNAINQPPAAAPWSKGININRYCGIVEHYPIEKSLKMISLMVKNVKQMSVVSSEGDSSQIVSKIFKEIKKDKSAPVKIREIYLRAAWADWKKAFLEINKKDQLAWILVPYEVFDENGKPVALSEMAEWIKSNVKVPLLGILSIHTKMGFLAAISVDPHGLGQQAAEIVIQLEKGKTCQEIGFPKSKYHAFEVNTDEVARLGMKIPEEFIGVATFIKSSKLEALKR